MVLLYYYIYFFTIDWTHYYYCCCRKNRTIKEALDKEVVAHERTECLWQYLRNHPYTPHIRARYFCRWFSVSVYARIHRIIMKQVNGIENEICELEKKAERNIFSTVVLKSIYITLSVVMFVMFVFSLVFSENSHPYYMSSIIFALLSIVFALTSYFYKEYRNGHRNWIMPGGKVIIVGWFFVFILLLIRLVSYQVYNSSIFAFDFGPKNCRMKSAVNALNKTIQGVKCETIHSYSFTFDFNKWRF